MPSRRKKGVPDRAGPVKKVNLFPVYRAQAHLLHTAYGLYVYIRRELNSFNLGLRALFLVLLSHKTQHSVFI